MIKKTDLNQTQIMLTLRKLGYSVFDTSEVGRGFPDLVIAKNSETYLIEIKSEKGKLNDKQIEFTAKWNAEIFVIRNTDEAIAFDRHELEAVKPNRTEIVINGYK